MEACAANRFSDDFSAKLGGGKSCEATLKFTDWRSNGAKNDGSFGAHEKPPEE
jgi:hypothetical protein